MTLPWRSSDSKCVCPMHTPACEVETTTRQISASQGKPRDLRVWGGGIRRCQIVEATAEAPGNGRREGG